ncbi:hypothetical protein NBRC116592_21600 [Colwellia sp. KU-HH00111]
MSCGAVLLLLGLHSSFQIKQTNSGKLSPSKKALVLIRENTALSAAKQENELSKAIINKTIFN